MNRYVVYGHSDDIGTVEGPGVDAEFYAKDGGNHIEITAADATGKSVIIDLHLLGGGQWTVGIRPVDDGAPIPIGSYDLDVRGYTAVLSIHTVERLTFVGYQGE